MYQVYYSCMNKVKNQTSQRSRLLHGRRGRTDLGIKPTAIRNYLTWGKMTTYKFKTLTLVDKKEVESWKERQK